MLYFCAAVNVKFGVSRKFTMFFWLNFFIQHSCFTAEKCVFSLPNISKSVCFPLKASVNVCSSKATVRHWWPFYMKLFMSLSPCLPAGNTLFV